MVPLWTLPMLPTLRLNLQVGRAKDNNLEDLTWAAEFYCGCLGYLCRSYCCSRCVRTAE
jgi:hypothetical protein